MSTKKILKFYLIATLSLSSVAVLSFSDTFRNYIPYYYTSVMDYKNTGAKAPAEVNIDTSSDSSDSNIYRENPAEVMFAISADSSNSLVPAGAKNANFMNLSFRIGQTDVQLNGIAFKISGANGSAIKNAYLTDGKAIVATASITGDKIKFPNMWYLMKAGTSKDLQLKVDLADNLFPGQIISLEIENSYDINMNVEGGSYSLNAHYPIPGKYLSIARSR